MYALVFNDGRRELARADYDDLIEAYAAQSAILDRWCAHDSVLRLGDYERREVGGTVGKVGLCRYRLRYRWTACTAGWLEIHKRVAGKERSL